MPITKTAKRALRGSKRKAQVNNTLLSKLEIAVRRAQKSKKDADVRVATSLADRAKKKGFYHKNKVARIKSALSKIVENKTKAVKSRSAKTKKASKK